LAMRITVCGSMHSLCGVALLCRKVCISMHAGLHTEAGMCVGTDYYQHDDGMLGPCD
jgi:hypothetical protein